MRTEIFCLLAFLLLFSGIPASPLPQQAEHAPTVAQCQADQALWLSKMENDSMSDVTVLTILAWEHEMQQCKDVDPANQDKYYNTQNEAIAAESIREANFIARAGLWERFVAEDAAGKR
jgi:hypothetical protein